MATDKLIKEFFEEQFNDSSQLFLYKDKKLLDEGKFREYAEEQIGKANKVFWSISFGLLMAVWYGTNGLINYGSDPTWFNLTVGLFLWFVALVMVWYASKEYYTIKSSMSFFIRLLDENDDHSG
ncbi:hypothetical protein [Gracilimonas amylolytica]|uniref:hypothetical protein n=1 Tax=Gracilimonas amylolytica TaxID=1749045 RepID=UPI000CD7FADD|nr:hypothetical protein [Gracilimonas amylolytica]